MPTAAAHIRSLSRRLRSCQRGFVLPLALGMSTVLAIVGTTIIAFVVKAVVGLRPSEEVEVAGLDLAEHGEEGYHAAGQL